MPTNIFSSTVYQVTDFVSQASLMIVHELGLVGILGTVHAVSIETK